MWLIVSAWNHWKWWSAFVSRSKSSFYNFSHKLKYLFEHEESDHSPWYYTTRKTTYFYVTWAKNHIEKQSTNKDMILPFSFTTRITQWLYIHFWPWKWSQTNVLIPKPNKIHSNSWKKSKYAPNILQKLHYQFVYFKILNLVFFGNFHLWCFFLIIHVSHVNII